MGLPGCSEGTRAAPAPAAAQEWNFTWPQNVRASRSRRSIVAGRVGDRCGDAADAELAEAFGLHRRRHRIGSSRNTTPETEYRPWPASSPASVWLRVDVGRRRDRQHTPPACAAGGVTEVVARLAGGRCRQAAYRPVTGPADGGVLAQWRSARPCRRRLDGFEQPPDGFALTISANPEDICFASSQGAADGIIPDRLLRCG